MNASGNQHATPHADRPPGDGTGYHCSMCSGVTSDAPGACPRCGMALVPDLPQAASSPLYICPMHPEIQRDQPGSCPKCGMDLVLKVPEGKSR